MAMTTIQTLKPGVNAKALAIGRRILTKREQKGYTQAELAGRIGVTEAAVTQYETGRTTPRPARLERLAQELDTTVSWLLTGDEPDEVTKAQTKDELEVLLVMRKLGSKADTVLALLKAMLPVRE